MNIKTLFEDKRKILRFSIITVGLLTIMFVLMLGMTYGTSVPKFCALCHIMKPEFATWEASSHSEVACVECHVDSGLTNALKHKVEATKELYKYVTKSYELPIRMTETIPDDRCLKCHSLKRKVSPSSDLYIPHQKHYDNKIACVKCHQGVAHGKIASRGMIMGGDFNKWDQSAGAKVMTTEFTSPKMDLCMDCHGRRGVTVACEACHSGSMKPDSHREKGFISAGLHGKLARKNIKYCDTCHAYIKAPGVTSQDMPEEEDPVAKYLSTFQTGADSTYTDYAKTNEYCTTCHKKRPESHGDSWPLIHGKEADKSPQKCLVCHSPRSDVQGTTSKAACSSCHPSIHESVPWRKSHPIDIPPKYPVLEPKCFQCHIKDVCAKCHRTSGPDNKNVKNPISSGPGSSIGNASTSVDANTNSKPVSANPPNMVKPPSRANVTITPSTKT